MQVSSGTVVTLRFRVTYRVSSTYRGVFCRPPVSSQGAVGHPDMTPEPWERWCQWACRCSPEGGATCAVPGQTLSSIAFWFCAGEQRQERCCLPDHWDPRPSSSNDNFSVHSVLVRQSLRGPARRKCPWPLERSALLMTVEVRPPRLLHSP